MDRELEKGTGREELRFLERLARTTDRRQFLRWSGVTVAAVAVAGCAGDVLSPTAGAVAVGRPLTDHISGAVNLGSGDIGILNYAYALEQLEAAFYTQVVATPYAGITPEEFQILEDLRKHEVVHRNFLRDALGASAIPMLHVTFASVTFSSRASVLGTAKVFEDLGVAAYNGAGQLLESAQYLVTAGKIVSVEARHAAAIRDLLNPKSADFAGDDVVDANGLDRALLPSQVLPQAAPFILTPIDASGLPTV